MRSASMNKPSIDSQGLGFDSHGFSVWNFWLYWSPLDGFRVSVDPRTSAICFEASHSRRRKVEKKEWWKRGEEVNEAGGRYIKAGCVWLERRRFWKWIWSRPHLPTSASRLWHPKSSSLRKSRTSLLEKSSRKGYEIHQSSRGCLSCTLSHLLFSTPSSPHLFLQSSTSINPTTESCHLEDQLLVQWRQQMQKLLPQLPSVRLQLSIRLLQSLQSWERCGNSQSFVNSCTLSMKLSVWAVSKLRWVEDITLAAKREEKNPKGCCNRKANLDPSSFDYIGSIEIFTITSESR